MLDPFKPYLHERLAGGQRNATVLLDEITERGYTRGYNTLRRYLRPLRHIETGALAALSPLPGRPAMRQVAGWITGLPGRLDPADAGRLNLIQVSSTYRNIGPSTSRWSISGRFIPGILAWEVPTSVLRRKFVVML
ncbi:MAG TPA: hypothetical protein VES60_02400 [Nakamurella sp.]|nr:hypothetical protein [Nakamurella sp.]